DFEDKILNADYKINELESNIFNNLCQIIITVSNDIQSNAHIISKIDIFSSLAYLAVNNKYIRPIINEKFSLIIKNGRHPVIENLILDSNQFIGNDIELNSKGFLSIITGPNMAGKSTYLRQIGIITIMAQIGSFVPADHAEIGLIDKLFTRVGASDNLSEGESTFLVEMQETANIINNSTKNSLILLDEIGRGTSTFDGLSIAWAVTEFIHNKIKAKTLFATHYHELVDLGNNLKNANNLNVLVEESSDKSDIVFLRKIIKGGTDKSYGIYVAKMAGLPSEIITKSKIYLELLNQDDKKVSLNNAKNIETIISKISKNQNNVSLDLINSLKSIDINNISPIEALNLLSHIIKKYVK
ncbi:MAG: DNA mismatch repair protein MutS, partial [Candidatus Marinimicrobia bacterium]|nr:DNA mismatch repair protein MutS [Candidatus Neomarinimicrobiota bacterium]